ncbi:MAG: FeoB-associated Cys-rich membrane protein [Clostridia bacterium]|nr:FeoB-associated Cys-rich membrane protein [Clostridia bacterium]
MTMGPVDFLILAIIVLVVGGASFYIIRAKKNGQRCIGCPDSKTCSGSCASCCGCQKSNEESEK